MANEQRSFDGVSALVWERLRQHGQKAHGTVFEGGDTPCGTATTPTPVGPVVLGFAFDAEAERITYTIIRKPFLAASSLIWGGIATAIERCRNA